MKSFLNPADKKEILGRLSNVRPDSQRRWGRMTPHQMICHLSDSFKSGLGENPHPYFGDMSKAQWMRWGYLHCDHHLRQFEV